MQRNVTQKVQLFQTHVRASGAKSALPEVTSLQSLHQLCMYSCSFFMAPNHNPCSMNDFICTCVRFMCVRYGRIYISYWMSKFLPGMKSVFFHLPILSGVNAALYIDSNNMYSLIESVKGEFKFLYPTCTAC